MCLPLSVWRGILAHWQKCTSVRVAEAMPAEPIIESCWTFLYYSSLVVLSGVRSWILNAELCLQTSYEIMPANLQNGPYRLFWQGQIRSNLGMYDCGCGLEYWDLIPGRCHYFFSLCNHLNIGSGTHQRSLGAFSTGMKWLGPETAYLPPYNADNETVLWPYKHFCWCFYTSEADYIGRAAVKLVL
jgi:hypothetical protein